MELTVDVLTQKYIELRDRRAVRKKAWQAEDDKDSVLMEGIERKLREMLDAQHMDSVRTEFGTVFKTYKEFANVGNWDEIIRFVKENDAFDMFEKRISKTAVRDRMEADTKGNYRNPPPPGVNFSRIETVQIRRS